MMRVLFLTQVLPYPLDAGPKIRAYYTLRYLARSHEVTLLSFVRDGDTPEALDHLRAFCREVHTVPMPRSRARDAWHLLRSLAGGEPFLVARDDVPAMGRLCTMLLAGPSNNEAGRPGFDVVHADQLWMARYALLARRVTPAGARPTIVLDQHNAVFQIPRRLAEWERHPVKRALLARESRVLARHEDRICRTFDRVVWVTDEDRRAVAAQRRDGGLSEADDERSSVIPICVDPEEQPVLWDGPAARRVTFMGGLHWPPNAEGIAWFAREVWPRVRQAVPDARCTVIGKSPPRALAAASGPGSGIEVTGYVDDPRPYLAETAAFVVPLRAGGGMRVKILDAWCRGLPVVSTRIGAEGIDVRDRQNVLLADTTEQFARAVVSVLREPELAARLAAEGRRTAERRYDWRTVYRAWDAIYQRPADRRVAAPLVPVVAPS